MSPAPPEDNPEDLYLRVFEKASIRKQSGCDPLSADWQAILEIALNLGRAHLLRNPGRLLPLQIGNDEEWEFYLDLLEKLDLPPDTYAVVSTPSFSETLLDAVDDQEPDGAGECEMPWGKKSYLIIISDCRDHTRIMQVSLPSASGSSGIDVYDDGKHLADYTYHTTEECIEALGKVPWIFFSPRGDWTEEQIIRYTENWFLRGIDTQDFQGMSLHSRYSYVHHPELLNVSPLEAVFRLLLASVPSALENLDTAIETANDLYRDLELGEAVVTKDGILRNDPEPCRSLFGRVVVEMEQQLEAMRGMEEIPCPAPDDPDYDRLFTQTAKKIYEKIVGQPCPSSITFG